MPVITRLLEFDYGHRVLGHEGKCKFLHGHRCKVEITVSSPELDSIGRVIDFGVLKTIVGGWIDNNLDHNILLCKEDPLIPFLTEEVNGRDPFLMDSNPTAENIAELIFNQSKLILPEYLKVENVRVWETPSCYADYSA